VRGVAAQHFFLQVRFFGAEAARDVDPVGQIAAEPALRARKRFEIVALTNEAAASREQPDVGGVCSGDQARLDIHPVRSV
jgi:hypothetical protein